VTGKTGRSANAARFWNSPLVPPMGAPSSTHHGTVVEELEADRIDDAPVVEVRHHASICLSVTRSGSSTKVASMRAS
jgi:hypothetical protein